MMLYAVFYKVMFYTHSHTADLAFHLVCFQHECVPKGSEVSSVDICVRLATS